MADKETLTDALVDDATADPDASKNSDRVAPQTTDAEPTSDEPPERVPNADR